MFRLKNLENLGSGNNPLLLVPFLATEKKIRG